MSKTIFPSVERIHLRNYPNGALNACHDIPEMSVYDFMEPSFAKYADTVGVQYDKNFIPISAIKANAEILARALRSPEFGVEKNHVVPVFSTFLPGVSFLLKALSDIGACPYFLKLASTSDEFKEETLDNFEKLEEEKLKMAPVAILFDFYFLINPSIRSVLDDDKFKKVLVLSLSDFLPFPKSTIVNTMSHFMKKKADALIPKNGKYIRYSKLKTFASYFTGDFKVPYEKGRAFAITCSSGTSIDGVKPTVQSHEAVIAQLINCDLGKLWEGHEQGDKTYTYFPPQVMTSTMCLHLAPLYLGGVSHIDPRPNIKTFYDSTLKVKYQHVITTGCWAIEFFERIERELVNRTLKSGDLNFIKNIILGGEGASQKFLDWMQEVADKAGMKENLIGRGYGLSETLAPMTKTNRKTILSPGKPREPVPSVGVGFPAFEIGIFNEEGNELGYNELGELRCKGILSSGYFGKPEAWQEQIDENGRLKTKDLAKIDEDGEVYIYGRMNDDITLSDNTKLRLPLVAVEIVSSHHAIFDCLVVKVPLVNGELLTAHLAFRESDYHLANEAILAAEEKMTHYLPNGVCIAGYVAYNGMLQPSSVGKRDRSLLINQPVIKKPNADGVMEDIIIKDCIKSG